jgi:hypothetical protein
MDKYANLDKLAVAMGYPNGLGLEFCIEIRSMTPGEQIWVARNRGLDDAAAAKIPGEFAAFMNGMRALLAPAR